jgi:nitroimidazol reductase NimA-like FMN-containing flavoprotein (pyridoxamine 5'-phosphate oxidase superfamily)
MNRREQIRMGEAEALAFLERERTVTCATLGPRGWPHLMPLWYVIRSSDGGPQLWAWTYAASQKTRNLERDPRATLQVETGETYDQLRGVMLECEVVVHRDLETVRQLGEEIFRRHAAAHGEPAAKTLDPQVAAMVRSQARKRVGLQFLERRRASWDHRKLRGVH